MRWLEKQREFDPTFRLHCNLVGTTTALILGGLAAAGSVGGAAIGANASKSVASTQASAAQQAADIAQAAGTSANQTNAETYNKQITALQPYVDAGTNGLDALKTALAPGGSLSQQFSFDPSKIADNPDYQFQLNEGLKAVQRAASATGTLGSGGTLKALTQYSQGLASNEIGQAYQQALSTFGTNRNSAVQNLSIPLSLGQYGTSGVLNALSSYNNLYSQNSLGTAQIVGNDLTSKANAQAAGTVGSANAYGGALGNLSNLAQTYALLSSLQQPQQTIAPGGQLPNTNTRPSSAQALAPYVTPYSAPAPAPSAWNAGSPYLPQPGSGGYLGSMYGFQ